MNERLKTHSKTQKKSADLVSNKLRIGVFQRYQMKCKSVSKKSPRYMDGKPVVPGMKLSKEKCDQVNAIERDKALAWVEKNIRVPLTEPQKAGIASFCPYNIGPGKCFPSTFYRRINAGDRRGACEAIRWWIKDGGRDCRIRSNNCYGQVSRRDQESALACWGIDR
ncbi:lysozyme [Escherichia coli O123:H11 str. 2009C-3307]|nr:lysozyme [Escherichia coli O123:H11 str. 2009C-3307]